MQNEHVPNGNVPQEDNQMKRNFQLNGNKGWIFSFIFVIVVQSIAVGFWAGGLNKEVVNIKETLNLQVNNIKEDVAEIKEDIKEIRNA